MSKNDGPLKQAGGGEYGRPRYSTIAWCSTLTKFVEMVRDAAKDAIHDDATLYFTRETQQRCEDLLEECREDGLI